MVKPFALQCLDHLCLHTSDALDILKDKACWSHCHDAAHHSPENLRLRLPQQFASIMQGAKWFAAESTDVQMDIPRHLHFGIQDVLKNVARWRGVCQKDFPWSFGYLRRPAVLMGNAQPM
jgi:hypothetical protein